MVMGGVIGAVTVTIMDGGAVGDITTVGDTIAIGETS
jgi:hypothetical protein